MSSSALPISCAFGHLVSAHEYHRRRLRRVGAHVAFAVADTNTMSPCACASTLVVVDVARPRKTKRASSTAGIVASQVSRMTVRNAARPSCEKMPMTPSRCWSGREGPASQASADAMILVLVLVLDIAVGARSADASTAEGAEARLTNAQKKSRLFEVALCGDFGRGLPPPRHLPRGHRRLHRRRDHHRTCRMGCRS